MLLRSLCRKAAPQLSSCDSSEGVRVLQDLSNKGALYSPPLSKHSWRIDKALLISAFAL